MPAPQTLDIDHSRRVTAWYAQQTRAILPKSISDFCSRSFSALMTSASGTLGEPTVEAIAERVLENAREKYPWLSTLSVRDGLLDPLPKVNLSQHPEVTCFLVSEFLVIASNLTGGLITARLYKDLES